MAELMIASGKTPRKPGPDACSRPGEVARWIRTGIGYRNKSGLAVARVSGEGIMTAHAAVSVTAIAQQFGFLPSLGGARAAEWYGRNNDGRAWRLPVTPTGGRGTRASTFAGPIEPS